MFARIRTSADLDWRVGMAVTKKLGTAVDRNRVKRVLREFFRLHQVLLPPALDFVVVPKRTLKPDRVSLDAVRRELLPLVGELRAFAAPEALSSGACGLSRPAKPEGAAEPAP